MENKFYIFGSVNSLDVDVFVLVDDIGSDITYNHELCKKFDIELYNLLSDSKNRPINSNLITINDGVVTKCFKGTPDECNNALFYTYIQHRQKYPNPIIRPIPRDIDIKTLRVTRCILSYYSRTNLRPLIKDALKRTIVEQLEVLKRIDFQNPIEGKGDLVDIHKIIAFQFGQFFSILDAVEPESYTKIDVCRNYPLLSTFINRQQSKDMTVLNTYLKRFIHYVEPNIQYMSVTSEKN